MPNTKISALPADGSVTGTEEFPVADAGVTKKISLNTLGVFMKGLDPFTVHLDSRSASLPAVNPAVRVKVAGTNVLYDVLDFDQTTAQSAYWAVALPAGITFTTATLEIYSTQAAATTGTVGWLIKTAARAGGDVIDNAGVTDTVTADNVEGVAGKVHRQAVALTITGWAASRMLFVTITRDVANDNVAENARFLGACIRLN